MDISLGRDTICSVVINLIYYPFHDGDGNFVISNYGDKQWLFSFGHFYRYSLR